MRWLIKLIFALAAIAVLTWLVIRIGSLTLGILSGGSKSGTRDPMFAEEAETVTPPPELRATEGVSRFEDNSANWDVSVQTPVDQTADELGEAARSGSDS